MDNDNRDGKSTNKGMSFMLLNCRSFYAKKDQLEKEFQDYDVIALSESWLNKNHDASMKHWQHKKFRLDRLDLTDPIDST